MNKFKRNIAFPLFLFLACICGTVISQTSGLPAGAVTAVNDGVHSGIMGLFGNTTLPTIPANQFGWLGFNSTSAAALFFQPSSTAPTLTNQAMIAGIPSSNVSQVTYSAVPILVATPTPLTAQAANVSFVTIYTTIAGNHYYQVCGEANLTRVATTSSTMVQIQIGYTSAVDSVVKVANIGTSPGITSNGTFADNSGCATLFISGATAIQWQTTGYVSAGATAMQYSLSGTVQLII